VEAKAIGDADKLGRALTRLVAEDQSFGVSIDAESGQTILRGMGKVQFADKVDMLKQTYEVEVKVGQPQVAYRETITRATTVDYTHKKQTGGSGQFARVRSRYVRMRPAKGSISRRRSSAAPCRRNTFPASRRDWSRS
jgi:elongation factor G